MLCPGVAGILLQDALNAFKGLRVVALTVEKACGAFKKGKVAGKPAQPFPDKLLRLGGFFPPRGSRS